MLDVFFPTARDLGDWAARHGRGEAPGEWPYGLEALRDFDASARAANLTAPTRFQVAVARLRPRRRGRESEGGIGLTWDENAAREMRVASPRARMFTGVIWATDIVRRGGDTGRMRGILRDMDGLFVISRGQVEPLREFVGADGPPVAFFPFGVDTDFFKARPYPTAPLVVSVGGDRDRDPATLFAALEVVRRDHPGAEIVVQSTSRLTPPPGVTVIPHLSHGELRELYARASVVALATRENLHASGMTVSLEAQATGRPVVMTATPGIDDYVADGVSGFLVPVGDAHGLATGIGALLADPVRAADFGRAGRAAVEGGMTTRHLAESLARFVGIAD